jgi:hypothetical protein
MSFLKFFKIIFATNCTLPLGNYTFKDNVALLTALCFFVCALRLFFKETANFKNKIFFLKQPKYFVFLTQL